ncbi:MAG: hypothetical protein ABIO55_17860 [Ginsengibacter sp.]
MEQNKKNKQPAPPENSPEKFKDEATKNKINQHLSDINDTISEDDIKNIITDISSSKLASDDIIETPEDKAPATDKKVENGTDDKTDMPTSWNILE